MSRAPISYRGYEITAYRERSYGGDAPLVYSVFRASDGLEITSGYAYDRDTVRTHRETLKRVVDRHIQFPAPDPERLTP